MHSLSTAQERQFVASPAKDGFLERLKYFNEPVEVIRDGKWGGPVG